MNSSKRSSNAALRKLDHHGRFGGPSWNAKRLNQGTSSEVDGIEGVDLIERECTGTLPKSGRRKVAVAVEETEESDDEMADVTKLTEPPLPNRVILESVPLSQLIEANCNCSRCHRSTLKLKFVSVGVATTPVLSCTHCEKDATVKPKTAQPKRTTMRSSHARGDANVDFEVNVKFVLAFVGSGDGGTEAARFLGFLSLPGANSMERRTFSQIERHICPYVEYIVDGYLHDNLMEEIRLTYAETEGNLDAWRESLETGDAPVDGTALPYIGTSTDMDGTKRSSGRTYDSHSGHACLVGEKTRKPVSLSTKCTFCRICTVKRELTEEIPEHECVINHDDGAGAMEAASLLKMTQDLYFDKAVCISNVVTDDDSKMRARCKWNNDDWLKHNGHEPGDRRKLIIGTRVAPPSQQKTPGQVKMIPVYRNSGMLKYPVPQPRFLADPAHRKKTLKNRLYKLKARSVKTANDMQEGDILRVSLYFIFFIRDMASIPENERVQRAQCIYKHHFDVHDQCGEWCKRKLDTTEQRSKSQKTYRSMEHDSLLYLDIKEVVEEFTTAEKLAELFHDGDTQVNESLNQQIAWLAPKTKTYCGSVSLVMRVRIAIAIHLVGNLVLWRDLFFSLGLDADMLTEYRLLMRDKMRNSKLVNSRKTEYRVKRKKTMHDKIQQYMKQLKIDKVNGMAYQSGSAMEADNGTPPLSEVMCSKCHQLGHKDARSGNCPNNAKNRRKRSKGNPTNATSNATSMLEEEDNNVLPMHKEDISGDGDENDISLIDNIPLTSDPHVAELSESLANDG